MEGNDARVKEEGGSRVGFAGDREREGWEDDVRLC